MGITFRPNEPEERGIAIVLSQNEPEGAFVSLENMS